MIPVRAVAESLGYTVEWFGGELKVTVNNDESGVEFKIGENSYKAKDAESCELEKQPELINDSNICSEQRIQQTSRKDCCH